MFRLILNTYKTSFSGLSRETWLLSVVMLINRCGYMAVPFMSLYMTQGLYRSTSDAGLIITLFGIGSILGSAAGGKLTDLIGFRPVQILASIIGGGLFILYATVTHFSTLCVLAVVISFFSEAFRPANFAAIATYAKAGTITRSYSLNRLATNVGWAVGASTGGLIASFSYPLLFTVDGGVSVLVGIIILFLLPSRKAAHKAAQAIKANIEVLKPWKDGLFIRFIVISSMFTTCFFVMFRVVPLFYKEIWHIDEFNIGLIMGLNGVVIALFEMVMINSIEKKRTPMFFIITGVLLVSLSYLVLNSPVVFHLTLAIVSMLFFTLGEMFSLPFINTFVINRSNEHNRGLYAAGYTLSWSFAQIVGPSGGFFLAEKLGYNWLWIIITCLLFTCAISYRLLLKPNNPAPL